MRFTETIRPYSALLVRTLPVRALLAGAALFAANAAAETADPIAYCASTAENTEQHISCLETAIRQLRADSGAAADAPIAVKGATPPAGANTIAAEEAVADAAEPELGAEQVARRVEKPADKKEKQRKQKIIAAVASFEYGRNGLLTLTLDNGQVWRQTDAGGGRTPFLSKKRTYTAEVKKGAVSGYRLIIRELQRSLQVERLK